MRFGTLEGGEISKRGVNDVRYCKVIGPKLRMYNTVEDRPPIHTKGQIERRKIHITHVITKFTSPSKKS